MLLQVKLFFSKVIFLIYIISIPRQEVSLAQKLVEQIHTFIVQIGFYGINLCMSSFVKVDDQKESILEMFHVEKMGNMFQKESSHCYVCGLSCYVKP